MKEEFESELQKSGIESLELERRVTRVVKQKVHFIQKLHLVGPAQPGLLRFLRASARECRY
jgi:hypothetical protein